MIVKEVDRLIKTSFTLSNIRVVYKDLRNKNSKGIDKMGMAVFEIQKEVHFKIIKRKVLAGEYSFSPYLENLKLKGRNQYPRIISIPTIRDRVVIKIMKNILHTVFPTSINKRLPNFYIKDIKKYVAKFSSIYFYQTDIIKFYDTINRDHLLNLIEEKINNKIFLSLLMNSLENPTVPKNTSPKNHSQFYNKYGVPQGLSISNILSNLYLNEFDNLFSKRKYLYLRYVDDILILGDKPLLKVSENNIHEHLLSRHLELNSDKTFRGPLSNKINYLGYSLGPIISVSEKNIQTFISSIASLFTHFKLGFYNKQKRPKWLLTNDILFKDVFVENLNERISGAIDLNKKYGWLFFFSEITDKNLLFKLDKLISSFFINLEIFDNKTPINLKKLVRAFFEIKFNPKSSYIVDYNNHDTLSKKIAFLTSRGEIDSDYTYSSTEINLYYRRFKSKQLSKLEKDTGYNYF